MGLSCSKSPEQKKCLEGEVTHKSVYKAFIPLKKMKSIYTKSSFLCATEYFTAFTDNKLLIPPAKCSAPAPIHPFSEPLGGWNLSQLSSDKQALHHIKHLGPNLNLGPNNNPNPSVA